MTGTPCTRFARPLVLATALAVLAGCGQTDDPSTQCRAPIVPASPAMSSAAEPGDGDIQGTFEVGGHDLFLDCEGTGTPTVVLMHGSIFEAADLADGGSSEWARTRDELGDTRTCAYDRRNVGQSEQVPGMSSAEDAIEDLRGLLQAAGENPPYVLAGYSFGGLLSLLYAGTYPDEVNGIVLVDATLPLEWDLDPPEHRPPGGGGVERQRRTDRLLRRRRDDRGGARPPPRGPDHVHVRAAARALSEGVEGRLPGSAAEVHAGSAGGKARRSTTPPTTWCTPSRAMSPTRFERVLRRVGV